MRYSTGSSIKWKNIIYAAIPFIIALTILEFIWYIIESILNPMLVSTILYPVKFLILIFAGYCAGTSHGMDYIGSTITGALTYGISTLLERIIVSPLFYPSYILSGFEYDLFSLLSSIVRSLILGGIFGALGFYIKQSRIGELLEKYSRYCFKLKIL